MGGLPKPDTLTSSPPRTTFFYSRFIGYTYQERGLFMSIIAGVTKNGMTAIAGDTQANFGDMVMPRDNHRASKIKKLGTSYIGKTGWAVYDNIFDDFISAKRKPVLRNEREIYRFFLALWKALHDRYALVNDQAEQKDSPFGDLAASFLVANRHGIYAVASDMSVTRFQKFYAIGSGNEFALGALEALYGQNLDAAALARKAVETAITFQPFCGGEIQVFCV